MRKKFFSRAPSAMLSALSFFGAMLFALSFPVEAQQAGKMPRIGVLSRRASPNVTDEAFRQGLRDLGWIEGQNIIIEYRWAAGKRDRLAALAEELVSLKIDIMVVSSSMVVRAAKKATTTIPIVMAYAADAVEKGYVASLARPGRNITGMSEGYADINTKLLEVLHDTLPKVTRVGFLWDPDSRTYTRTFRAAQAVAPGLGLTLQSLALPHKGRSMKKITEELESMFKGVRCLWWQTSLVEEFSLN